MSKKTLNRNSKDKRRTRVFLIQKYGFICPYCRIYMNPFAEIEDDYPSIEHIIPKSKGGSDKRDNLMLCCIKCNTEHKNPLDTQKKRKKIR